VRKPPELDELLSFSAQIGRDPLLTQGFAGNTSIKIDGRLWIKASGKWLANAVQEDIFLPLDLAQIRSSTHQQRATTTVTNLSGEELTPSIETAMHATLPQRVVVHVHSVNTLARAVRVDAPEHLASQLRGLRWHWVPYVRSGLPLAREIERVAARSSGFDILVLGNHGLVICGDSCRSVDFLLKQVEVRMGLIPRRAPQCDRGFLLRLMEGSNWRLPEHTGLHSLATDEVSRGILANGSLYPCQALILGGAEAWRTFYSGLYCEASRNREQGSYSRPFLIVKDKGVLLSSRITTTELETLIGLAEVVQRIEPTAPIRYLTKAECEEVERLNIYRSDPVTDNVPLSA
jgi:ribulose-5-phosphate 4-epimerase/fuculose-1-phosphate aldolase